MPEVCHQPFVPLHTVNGGELGISPPLLSLVFQLWTSHCVPFCPSAFRPFLARLQILSLQAVVLVSDFFPQVFIEIVVVGGVFGSVHLFPHLHHQLVLSLRPVLLLLACVSASLLLALLRLFPSVFVVFWRRFLPFFALLPTWERRWLARTMLRLLFTPDFSGQSLFVGRVWIGLRVWRTAVVWWGVISGLWSVLVAFLGLVATFARRGVRISGGRRVAVSATVTGAGLASGSTFFVSACRLFVLGSVFPASALVSFIFLCAGFSGRKEKGGKI